MAEPDNEDRRGLTPPAGQTGPVRRAPLRRPRRPGARETKPDVGGESPPPSPDERESDPLVPEERAGERHEGPAGEERESGPLVAEERAGERHEGPANEFTDRGAGDIEADPTEVEQRLGYRARRKRRRSATRPAAPSTIDSVRYRGARRSRGWIVGGAVGVVVLVASVVAAVVFAVGIGRITDEQELRQEYSTFAQQMVVNLTSLNADNVDDAMATLEDKTSGRAHQQMQDSMKQAVSLVRDQNLDTKSTVISDAVTLATADEGTVILVYGWQMKPEKPDEQTIVQTFRWRVQITRINDELKMTNFEWVT
ncbi:MAG: hypothetical protein CME34_22385 [Gordonia sp.]|jgi:Mce-associated membrane protein|nr:hypothetical protein [Gordonia sp. (in: high G+C Gram-positive bacteria)]